MALSPEQALAELKRRGYTNDQIAEKLGLTKAPAPTSTPEAPKANPISSAFMRIPAGPVDAVTGVLPGLAAKAILNNPEASINAAPAIGTAVGGAFGNVPGAALGGAAGAAVKQLGRKAMGLDPITSVQVPYTGIIGSAKTIPGLPAQPGNPLETMGKYGFIPGLMQAVSQSPSIQNIGQEAIAGGIAQGVPQAALAGVAKTFNAVKEPLKAVGGRAIDLAGNMTKGSGKAALENPEVTKEGFINAEAIRGYASGLSEKLSKYASKVKNLFSSTARKMDAVNGNEGKVPVKNVVYEFQKLKDKLGVGSKGIQTINPQTKGAIDLIENELADEIQGKTHFTLQEALKLRQRLDRITNYDVTGQAGAGIDAGAVKPLRDFVDSQIAKHYSGFKLVDKEYQKLIETEQTIKESFGIPQGTRPEHLTPSVLNKVEKATERSLKKGASESDALERIGQEIGDPNILNKAKEFAAAQQFQKQTTPFGIGPLGFVGYGVRQSLGGLIRRGSGVVEGAKESGPFITSTLMGARAKKKAKK